VLTIPELRLKKQQKQKITMLTCYDATFAAVIDEAGIDIVLVGDSLGMTIEGHDSTVSVTLETMCYHTAIVKRKITNALIVADLPFGSYEESREKAYHSAVQLMKAGANLVKLEGGEACAPTVTFLQRRGIPVCGHIGLTPQSVNVLGGYQVQGKGEENARRLLQDAIALDEAGACLIVIECVPRDLSKKISEAINTPTIGIGAGPDTDGQVLVVYDLLGLYAKDHKPAKFVRNFLMGQQSIQKAILAYKQAVEEGSFPNDNYSFH
jgi:3-methyl-2-oxobutanoate hydroxymethyltransferase